MIKPSTFALSILAKRLCDSVLISAISTTFFSFNYALASQVCYSECRAHVSAIADTQSREGEFLLCYKLCKMEERQPSESAVVPEPRPSNAEGEMDVLFNQRKLAPLDDSTEGGDSTKVEKDKKETAEKNETGEKKETDSAVVQSDKKRESTCVESFDGEVSNCEQATLNAARACDENNSSLSSVANLASQATLLVGQKGAGGIHESCSKMAKLAKAANLALVAYRQLCASAIRACTAACTANLNPKCGGGADSARLAGEARAAMQGNASTCQQFSVKMSEASAAAQNFSMMHMNSKSCSMLTDGSGSVSDICKLDPKNPVCESEEKMDCSKAEMAAHKVCICRKSPLDPICSENSVVSEKQLMSVHMNRVQSGKRNLETNPEKSLNRDSLMHGEPSKFIGESVDSGVYKSGQANLASPNLGPGLEKRLRRKKGVGDHPVVEGLYSSTGNQSGSEEKKYEKLNIDVNGNSKKIGDEKRVENVSNLRDFLPGGIHNPHGKRGLAGGPGEGGLDGITGPHSDIWMKIRNCYQAISATLHP